MKQSNKHESAWRVLCLLEGIQMVDDIQLKDYRVITRRFRNVST